MTNTELPLFPLNTVMFPGAPLTLHIFEERYRTMIGRCLEDSQPFGVVLIREGDEVGNPALHTTVGTTVSINASVRLEDGRLLIATTGQQRFRVETHVQQLPYMVAEVTLLPDEEGSGLEPAVRAAQTTYNQYWQAIAQATGTTTDVEKLPGEPLALSYHLAHRLQVTNQRKQRWLEVSAAARLREITSMLRAEMKLLPGADDSSQGLTSGGPWSRN